jgi:hypothetical protein
MKVLLFLFIPLLMASSKLYATGVLRMQSETMFSLRNDYHQKLEAPFYEYFGANYETFNRSLVFDSNFSIYANPNKSGENNFELYLLNASYEIIPGKLVVQAGRTADFTKSAGSLLSDQLSFKYSLFEKQGSVGAYVGIERDLNSDVEKKENDTQIGAKFDYHTLGTSPYYFESKLQKEINKTYSEDYATVGFHGPLLTSLWGSEFLLSGEHNITNAQTRRLETGVDFYPSMKFANRWRLLSYKSRPMLGEEHDPIFSVISKGRLYEVTTLLDYLIFTNLTLSGALSFNDYLLQETTRAQGYRTELNVNYFNSSFKLSDKVYYFQSYGGKIYGSRIALALVMFNPYELSGSADVTYYTKITSARAIAFSSDLLLGKVVNDFKWQVGSEFNTNNVLNYDFRFLTKLTYTGWRVIND